MTFAAAIEAFSGLLVCPKCVCGHDTAPNPLAELTALIRVEIGRQFFLNQHDIDIFNWKYRRYRSAIFSTFSLYVPNFHFWSTVGRLGKSYDQHIL